MSKVTLGPQTLIYPKPVLLVGADVDGKPNFMTVAWGGIANATPPMISVAIRTSRHTLKGIKQNQAFSVNIPSTDMVKQADYCGIASGSKEDKVKACGFNVFRGSVKAPLIQECPINLECTVEHTLELGSHNLIVGRIVETHISEDCLSDEQPDVDKVRPISYITSPATRYQALGEVLGRAFHIGRELKGGG